MLEYWKHSLSLYYILCFIRLLPPKKKRGELQKYYLCVFAYDGESVCLLKLSSKPFKSPRTSIKKQQLKPRHPLHTPWVVCHTIVAGFKMAALSKSCDCCKSSARRRHATVSFQTDDTEQNITSVSIVGSNSETRQAKMKENLDQ